MLNVPQRPIFSIIDMIVSRLTLIARRDTARVAGALIVALVCSAWVADRAVAFGLTVTVQPPSVVEGQAFNGIVATAVDASALGGADVASNYAATIAWGDGVTTSGTVIAGGGEFVIIASGVGHTYAEEGSYTLTVEVSDIDGSSGTGSSILTIADAPLSAASTAAPSIFSGVGSIPTLKALSAFEAGIGGANNSATAGEQAGGFRTVNWDEVKLDGGDFGGATTTIAANHVVAIPDDRFASRGIDLRAPIAVAGDGFLSVNPAVGGRFSAFSAPNIAAPFSGDTVALDIVAPTGPGGTPAPAATQGFGAVLLNVKLANTTSIEYFSGDTLLARLFAPAGGAESFVGGLFSSPVVTGVVVKLGTAEIFSFDGTTFAAGPESSEGPSNNLVAMDDLALAEPAPEAPPLSGAVGAPLLGTASFSDSDPNSNARDFTASIDWGDGTRGGARVSTAASGGFAVVGGHSYSAPGTFAVAISIQDLGGAKHTFHTTATITAAVSSSPPPTQTPLTPPASSRTAPHCSLTVPKAVLSRASPGAAASKRRKVAAPPSRLRAIARCDQAAKAILAATASLTPVRKAHGAPVTTKPTAVSLGQVSADLSANAPTTLTIKLTAKGLAKLHSGVARHERVSVKLTLTAANSNGTAGASVSIAILKLR